jgi:hypothetical protein
MLCSSDLIAFQAEHLDLLFPNRSSHNPTVRTDSPPAYQQPQRGGHSYDIPLRPPDLTRRSVSMDYPATADSPPRPPRRDRPASIRATLPNATSAKDEDWQIVSLDEESTVASHGNNVPQPLSQQENEMIMLALERSLEELSSPGSASPPNPVGAGLDKKLWWVKGDDQKWAVLPFPMQDDSTEENEMLEMVLKSSLLETMKQVHLHVIANAQNRIM